MGITISHRTPISMFYQKKLKNMSVTHRPFYIKLLEFRKFIEHTYLDKLRATKFQLNQHREDKSFRCIFLLRKHFFYNISVYYI